MACDAIPPHIRAIAHHVCTPDELDVLRLYAHGYGYRAIARILDIDRDTARNRLTRASRKIREATNEQTPGETPARPART